MSRFLPSSARMILAAGVSAVLVSVFGAVGPASAAGPAVTCGATLKSNAVLTKDVSCPNGNGVTLYRGVTLDLNGHKLVGPGSSGTAVTLSYKGGSKVINGRLANWAFGVVQDGLSNPDPNPADGVIKNVTLTKAPVVFLYINGSISGSTFVDSPVNFMYADVTAAGSKFTRSSISGSQGLATVSGSTIIAGSVSSGDSRGVDISTSTLDGTGYVGSFAGCFESPVIIKNSTVKNYGSAFVFSVCSVSFTGNTFINNPDGVVKFFGIDSSVGPGTLSNNSFTSSGIAIEAINGLTATGNTFTANTTGIYLHNPQERGELSSDTDSVVTGNTFSRNTSSGIRSSATALTVGNNKAINNGKYGIYAPAANDLGGNVAYGNKQADCVGLTCSSK